MAVWELGPDLTTVRLVLHCPGPWPALPHSNSTCLTPRSNDQTIPERLYYCLQRLQAQHVAAVCGQHAPVPSRWAGGCSEGKLCGIAHRMQHGARAELICGDGVMMSQLWGWAG